jgi:hypothetical protein
MASIDYEDMLLVHALYIFRLEARSGNRTSLVYPMMFCALLMLIFNSMPVLSSFFLCSLRCYAMSTRRLAIISAVGQFLCCVLLFFLLPQFDLLYETKDFSWYTYFKTSCNTPRSTLSRPRVFLSWCLRWSKATRSLIHTW